ncbi:ribonuclease T2 [Vigna unguiculata]|uniref:Ribonuclease T2 n=1 Tax=Vigna unguiculata TaxID=3917 RepID=A0A4D6LV60_VIGUN|nr:ribonuclease T2 [Vigna unguiculata]
MKHGTCSNMQQFDFFRLTLDIYARNDLEAILINAGISHGKPYHINDIISAIRNSAIGVEPELHCGRSGLIFEIRICLNTDPIPQYINCASQGTCTSPRCTLITSFSICVILESAPGVVVLVSFGVEVFG